MNWAEFSKHTRMNATAADLYRAWSEPGSPRWSEVSKEEHKRWCACAEFVETKLRMRE